MFVSEEINQIVKILPVLVTEKLGRYRFQSSLENNGELGVENAVVKNLTNSLAKYREFLTVEAKTNKVSSSY